MGVASEEPAADTAGDTGDDWLGEEPDVQASETQDFDVVIIGAGLSGVCAARAAAEEGAKVAIVEKSSSFNCRSGEYALLNGSLNKRWGRENIVDEDVVVDRLMRECTYRNKRSILKKWASHAHEVMDWFIEAYPELTICDSTREAVTQEQFDKVFWCRWHGLSPSTTITATKSSPPSLPAWSSALPARISRAL